jgi:hypothetical protein
MSLLAKVVLWAGLDGVIILNPADEWANEYWKLQLKYCTTITL